MEMGAQRLVPWKQLTFVNLVRDQNQICARKFVAMVSLKTKFLVMMGIRSLEITMVAMTTVIKCLVSHVAE